MFVSNYFAKKSLLSKAILTALIALINTSAFADFTQFDASYKVRFDKFKAKSAMSLRQNPETGELTYTTYTKPKGFAKLFGKITESLTFDFNQQTIIPKAYRHDSRDDVRIDYDWEENLAVSNTEDGQKKLALTGQELDLLSLQMQLSRDLKNNTLNMSYTIIKDNTLKSYNVTRLGEGTYTFNKKTYATVIVQQQREGSSRRSVLQFAPELDFVLVHMQQFKGEKRRASFDMYAYKKIEPAKTSNQ